MRTILPHLLSQNQLPYTAFVTDKNTVIPPKLHEVLVHRTTQVISTSVLRHKYTSTHLTPRYQTNDDDDVGLNVLRCRADILGTKI